MSVAATEGAPTKALPQRLINTHTCKLVDFSDNDQIPPYAILSHRWLHGEEVSYQEFQELRPETKKKLGYRKIQGACKQAILNGLDFIWIDTCCIDQRNHIEIARNINSMYSYYRNCQVCYAYLADVYKSNDEVAWITSMVWRSGWFQRGWTLQELVAPRRVVFFNAGWEPIGDKHQLSSDVSRLTGIPPDVLDGGRSVEDVVIQERMAWCAGRQTTRPPDLAYCLLGILGVSMIPNYTEDAKTAFERLQKALVHSYPDRFQESSGGDIYSILLRQNARARIELGSSHSTTGLSGTRTQFKLFTPHHSLNVYSAPLIDLELKYSITSTYTPQPPGEDESTAQVIFDHWCNTVNNASMDGTNTVVSWNGGGADLSGWAGAQPSIPATNVPDQRLLAGLDGAD